MSTYKTYISFVIQKEGQHVHGFEIVDLPLPKYSFYLGNSSQQVIKWALEKQREFEVGETVVILNFFNVSNVK
jgi:uncharacterized membrane protein YczE